MSASLFPKFPLQQLPGHSFRQGLKMLDSTATKQGIPFDEPEPFRHFSLIAIIGTAGNRLMDTGHI